VHDKLNKKEFLERVQKGAEQLLKLEKKTGKVAKRWAKAKKKIASRAEVLAVVEKTEKDFTASAKKMRDAVAKLKPVGAKAKHVTNKLSLTTTVLKPKRVACALMSPALKFAKLLKPLLDGIRKAIDKIFGLPIIKQIFGALNWVLDQIWKGINSVLGLDKIFNSLAETLNPLNSEMLQKFKAATEEIRNLGYETVQPIRDGMAAAVPLDFKFVPMSTIFQDDEFKDLDIPVGVVGFG